MADEEGLEALRERLISHSGCFNSLLELIPPKYYFADSENGQGTKFFKNKKNKAPKQSVKEASKKAKLLRLDPSNHKTVIELQTESSARKREGESNGPLVSVEDVACSNINELRVRLQERIGLLRKKRKATSAGDSGTEKPTKKAKRKSKEDKKSQRVKSGSNIVKLNGNVTENGKKTIISNDGKIVFSKFDFSSDMTATPPSSTGKMKKKNYKKLLEKAEDRKKKLQELKKTDGEKAKEIVQKEAWRKALGKSEGLKQKDDPAMLRKSLKRKEKLKSKRQREWKGRVDNEAKQIKERQQQRQKNIKERIENKKKKKMKKGGRTPGF